MFLKTFYLIKIYDVDFLENIIEIYRVSGQSLPKKSEEKNM